MLHSKASDNQQMPYKRKGTIIYSFKHVPHLLWPGKCLGWRGKALPSRSWEATMASNYCWAAGKPEQQHQDVVAQPWGLKVRRGDGEDRAYKALHRGDLRLDLGIHITPRQVFRIARGSRREVSGPWRYLRPPQGVSEVKTILILLLRCIATKN